MSLIQTSLRSLFSNPKPLTSKSLGLRRLQVASLHILSLDRKTNNSRNHRNRPKNPSYSFLTNNTNNNHYYLSKHSLYINCNHFKTYQKHSNIFQKNNQNSTLNNNSNNNNNNVSNISKRGIFVQIDKTPNVYSLKFTPAGHSVLPPNMTLNVGSYKEAIKKSELAKELFIIEGVTNVFLTDTFISVTVDDTSKWADIQGNVVAIINDFLLSEQPVYIESDGSDGDGMGTEGNYDEDDEVVAVIRELIDTRIRPNVQYDGGDVVYRGFNAETGVVSLELVGACKGCASSNVTLYNGIERMLTFYVPEVSAIEEVQSEENQRLQEISQAAYEAVTNKLESKNKDGSEESDETGK